MQLLYKVAIIARFLNLTERRVQQLARDGIIPKAEKGKYDLVQCVHGYVRFLQDRLGGDGQLHDTHQERARLIKAQADKTELEVAALREHLVAIEQIERDWLKHITACRMRLLSMPSKLAFQLAGLTKPAEIEALLKRGIYEALAELADFNHDEDHQQSGTGMDAPAGTDSQPVGRRQPKAKSRSKRRTGTVAN